MPVSCQCSYDPTVTIKFNLKIFQNFRCQNNSNKLFLLLKSGCFIIYTFIYYFFLLSQGKTYGDCIDVDNDGELWCSTTPVYEGSYVNCNETNVVWTEGGPSYGNRCVFPFTYLGKEYHTCTRVDHTQPWCSTTREYTGDNNWGNCLGNAKHNTLLYTVLKNCM